MQKIEDKYRKLTEVEHVLQRPGMYIGSIVNEVQPKFVFDEKFTKVNIRTNPGFIKLFDEILSNSVDEAKRNKALNKIKVTVDRTNNTISVWDNGGIPVEIHKTWNMYVPTLIFSNLRAGSNFNDDEQREGVGTNGIGAKATAVFSTEFKVETADGKNKFEQTFSGNLTKKSKEKITPSSKHYTEITYHPDFGRFGMTGIDDDIYKLIEKRVYDAAACNTGIQFTFDGNQIKFKSFKDYAMLYLDDGQDVFFESNKSWEVGISNSTNGFQNISFVNGVETYDGGRHVDYVLSGIIEYIRDKIKKKYKYDLKPSEVKNHISLFVNCTIPNPAFSSQTKEKLITEPKNFGSDFKFTEKTLKQIYNSEVVASLIDWIEQKKKADDKAAVRAANKTIGKLKINKLIDAKGKDRSKCVFFIAEGDSPLASFRKFRNPEIHGAIPIRGKIRNVYELKPSQALENEEVKSIFAALGLKIGECPFTYDKTGKIVSSTLRYGEIAIMTDADTDGDCIAGLLLNIFYKFFPELILHNRIFRIQTPILAASKSGKTIEFYSQEEYDEWCKKNDSRKYDISYFKGLAALSDAQSNEMINNPRKFYFAEDEKSPDMFRIWFGNDSEPRKIELSSKNEVKPIVTEVITEIVEKEKHTNRLF